MGVYILCTNPFVHSVLDGNDTKWEGGSEYVSDRRKITKTEGKMKLEKETHWRYDEMCT
jgi:hypothetical protein